MNKLYFKDINIQVTAAGQSYKTTVELDKSVKIITHFTIYSNRDDLAYYRGTFGLEINKDEIIPDGYSAKKIMCWPTVSADKRLKPIGKCTTGNGQVTFQYTDTNDGLTVFTPYTVTLSIEGDRESNV